MTNISSDITTTFSVWLPFRLDLWFVRKSCQRGSSEMRQGVRRGEGAAHAAGTSIIMPAEPTSWTLQTNLAPRDLTRKEDGICVAM